jgi:hypothetical protein
VVVAGGWSVGACSSNVADATIAAEVCTGLRDVDNEIFDVVNRSVAGIAGTDVHRRLPAILRGADGVERALGDWDRTIDLLDLPGTEETRVLRRQLHAGVVQARDELADQRRLFEEGEQSVVDDEVQGVVGVWFNSVEKIVSSLEPQIFRFDRRAYKQAFLDEPGCRNVVQPFVDD